MLGLLKHAFALIRYFKSRLVAVAALSVVLAFIVFKATSMMQIVQIREGDKVETFYTMHDNPQDILEEYGYTTMAYDAVDFTGFNDKLGEININRAFPVRILCDGKDIEIRIVEGNVSKALELAGIALGAQDIIDPAPECVLQEGDVITITRQTVANRLEEIELPFETVKIPTSLVAPGKEKVLTEGVSGLRVDTYSCVIVDGIEQEERLISEDTVRSPQDCKILVGFPSQPVSPLNFEIPFDENGEPAEYKDVLRGQKAAGYSAPAGAKTASGRNAMVGHVAVNPNVIPYGSKLYIQSQDGKFVYGYAVAADTGTALTQGIITVDLFYASYAESALNGIKSVDIFILE